MVTPMPPTLLREAMAAVLPWHRRQAERNIPGFNFSPKLR